jgi:UDP-N-acetylglucosamine 4,6-dehydratase
MVFSRGEFKQFEMAQVFPLAKYPCIRYFIGDIRDKERLYRAFQGVDYVIHTAALKQVTAAEYNPFEAIATNILGSQNIINVAIDQEVKKVIALSTDKAANPANLYGATKLCAEKLFVAGNSYVGRDKTIFSVARYGNVMGSRGSVLPFFLAQRKSGVLPITDPRMTRFWVSLDHVVYNVLKYLEIMVGGEIFIPKLPSIQITDLAKAIGPECQTKIVGIRPGEKFHEVLVTKEEARRTLEFEDHFIIKPDFKFFERRFSNNSGKPLPEDFEYNSKANHWWFSVEEIRQLVADYEQDPIQEILKVGHDYRDLAGTSLGSSR